MVNFSCIIPVYNSSKYIKKCVDSIISLSRKDLEIVIVNDGSMDDSDIICKSLARKYDCIKYYYKENGGVSSARNMGINNANGKYVLFVDSDDVVNYSNELFDSIISDDDDIVIFGMEVIQNKKVKIHTLQDRKLIFDASGFVYLLNNNRFNSPCDKIYKRELIKDYFIENIDMGEDYLFNLKYFRNIKNMKLSSAVCYSYYMDHSSATANSENYDPRSAITMITETYNFLSDINGLEQLANFTPWAGKIVRGFLINCFDIFNTTNDNKLKNEYARMLFCSDETVMTCLRGNYMSKVLENKWFCYNIVKMAAIIKYIRSRIVIFTR